ncbi:hypothetical protein [Balneola vulgaris]|uniref:hypothetical protein n=1 Tax=Balneola vulgaris TaxID=287535 RepID=UPI000372803B|nr:hypothetical protein [Balneola vulgaris]
MSRQEVYAWASFASSIAIAGLYTIYVLGWGGESPTVSDQLSSVLIKVFLFAFIIELVIGVLDSKDGVSKDERDYLIASKGYRNAYGFLCAAVCFVLFQIPFSSFYEQSWGLHFNIPANILLFHTLLFVLLFASMINRGTQIYFYRKEF